MAKKKSNPQSAAEDNNNKPTKTQPEIPIDDEKLHSLKSLNAMLLKETMERRQQVDSLTLINGSLESQLDRCKSEFTEREMMMEIEKGLVSRFVAVQVSEMQKEIGGLERYLNRVLEEKSAVEIVMNKKDTEIGSLNSRLSSLVAEIGEEKFILSRVCEERDEIRAQLDDKIQLEKGLKLKLGEAEKREDVISEITRKLKGDYDELVKEKTGIERKMDSMLRENNELVQKLQKGEQQLLKKVADLEKECVVSSENEMKIIMEIDILVKEKLEMKEALGKLEHQKLTIDRMVKEKSEGESNIMKLKQQMQETKNTVVQINNNLKQYESEAHRYKAALDDEKLKTKNLSEEISNMQKKLSKMLAEKNDEILVIKKSLAKTRKEHDDSKAKLKHSEADTGRILKLLKNTSMICCNSKENVIMGGNGIDQEIGEEIKHHVTEVEAIKKAFMDKESVVNEMKKELELLKVRVVKADKGKSFWTMVSSATTILAAAAGISLAYVARGGGGKGGGY